MAEIKFSEGQRCPYWATEDGREICRYNGSQDTPGQTANMRRLCPMNIKLVTRSDHRFDGSPIPEGARIGMEAYIHSQNAK